MEMPKKISAFFLLFCVHTLLIFLITGLLMWHYSICYSSNCTTYIYFIYQSRSKLIMYFRTLLKLEYEIAQIINNMISKILFGNDKNYNLYPIPEVYLLIIAYLPLTCLLKNLLHLICCSEL